MIKEAIMENRQPEIPLRPQDGQPPARRATDAEVFESYLPPGPALLYVHTHDPAFGSATVTRVDTGGVPLPGGPVSEADALRERALLRALLVHTLAQLDSRDD